MLRLEAPGHAQPARAGCRGAHLVHADVVHAGVEGARLAVHGEVLAPAPAVVIGALVLQVLDAPARPSRSVTDTFQVSLLRPRMHPA